MDINLYNSLCEKLKAVARNGNVEAMMDLAELIRKGPNLDENNIEDAMPYYLMAAEYGNEYAMNNAGVALYYGVQGVERDVEKGLTYIQKTAERGNPVMQFVLAQIYEAGETVSQDLERAMSYYLKSAEGGYPDAAYRLSMVKLKLDHQDWLKWLCIAYVCDVEDAKDAIDKEFTERERVMYDVESEIKYAKSLVQCDDGIMRWL